MARRTRTETARRISTSPDGCWPQVHGEVYDSDSGHDYIQQETFPLMPYVGMSGFVSNFEKDRRRRQMVNWGSSSAPIGHHSRRSFAMIAGALPARRERRREHGLER